MIKVNPKKRLLADSYLKKGYHNNLFKKTCDGYIMGTNNTEVNTLKDTISQAKKAKEVDNKTKILTLQLP